jgi:hypothetical protein
MRFGAKPMQAETVRTRPQKKCIGAKWLLTILYK